MFKCASVVFCGASRAWATALSSAATSSALVFSGTGLRLDPSWRDVQLVHRNGIAERATVAGRVSPGVPAPHHPPLAAHERP